MSLHVLYVGVSNQFGSARAMATWDKAYEEFHGLPDPKPLIEVLLAEVK